MNESGIEYLQHERVLFLSEGLLEKRKNPIAVSEDGILAYGATVQESRTRNLDLSL